MKGNQEIVANLASYFMKVHEHSWELFIWYELKANIIFLYFWSLFSLPGSIFPFYDTDTDPTGSGSKTLLSGKL